MSSSIAISSAVVDLTLPAYTSSADAVSPDPASIAPVRTLTSDRFIALHMIFDRMMPDAPTSDPAMIRTLLFSTNPVAAAARPEYELRSAMATGMSAPPIGIVSRMPRIDATPTSAQYAQVADGSLAIKTPRPIAVRKSSRLTSCWPGKTIGRPGSTRPCSLSKATRLPQNVTPPMSPDRTVGIVIWSVGSVASVRTAPATSTDAPPPKPLKIATISGIEVILTFKAKVAPIAPAHGDAAPLSTGV